MEVTSIAQYGSLDSMGDIYLTMQLSEGMGAQSVTQDKLDRAALCCIKGK